MCKDLPNFDEIQEKYDKNLTLWYCMDFDAVNSLGGNWDGNFVKNLRINTNQCTNSTSNNNSCAPLNIIQSEINNNVTQTNILFLPLYARNR